MEEENKKTIDMCSKVFVSWNLEHFSGEAFKGNSPEMMSDPLSSILLNKMKYADIGVNLPDKLVLLLSLCSDTPGMIQMLCYKILKNIPNLQRGYTVTPQDFARVFPVKFPIYVFQDVRDEIERMWKEQKQEFRGPFSDNKCDTKEYWQALLTH